MIPRTGRPPSERRIALLLALLLVWSLAVRVWYGSLGLDPTRFWDERYGLENIAALLDGGSLRPANGFHPSLSYLPQAALLAASEGLHGWTGHGAFAIRDRDGFTPTAYLLCRLLQALFGAASLYLVFRAGRRLAGPEVGLAAALLLSAVPWHIRQSAIFKPDILLVLTVVGAFLATLRALERPGARAYAGAGTVIGLALAAKFNGGPAALPLIALAAVQARRERRALLWLALAGGCALAVFLLLNPYVLLDPEIYRRSMGRTLRDYAAKGFHRGESGPLFLPLHAVGSLLSDSFHGPVVGALALAAPLVAAALALRRLRAPGGARDGEARAAAGWLGAAVYAVGYVALYAATTTNPSAHNWLPLTPFTALAAAWLALRLWGLAARFLPAQARPRLAAAAAALAALAVLVPAQRFAYRTLVPVTADVAGHLLTSRLGDLEGRLVYSEVEISPPARRVGAAVLAYRPVARLDDLAHRALDLADAELFHAARLEGEAGPFFARRMAGLPEERVVRIEPRLFRARGPRLIALVHPLERSAADRSAAFSRLPGAPDLYASEQLDALPPGSLVSVEIWLPARDGELASGEIVLGSGTLPLVTHRLRRRQALHLSPRFETGPGVRLRLRAPEGLGLAERHPFALRLWREPAPAVARFVRKVDPEATSD